MWGATPVTRERGRDGHRAHRGAVAAGLRRERGAGDRGQPGRRPGRVAARLGRPAARAGSSCGWPTSTRAVRLPPAGVGEIQVAEPVGHGRLPARARRPPTAFADGWYRTGDVGWLEPDGWVHLTDRSKEMIKVNGFQVAPAEIEAVLHGHPGVLDCAVFGIADEQSGEVPVAAVQLDPGGQATVGRAQPARRRLARHLQAAPRRRRRRRHPAAPVGQGAAADAAGRVGAAAALGPGRHLMDVRLSPEQLALRDSAAPGRRPARRPSRRRARRHRAGRQARRGRGRLGLARAAGRRSDGRSRWPRGSKWRSSPRSWAGAWPTPPFSGRRWPPSCAGWRGAGAPQAAKRVALRRLISPSSRPTASAHRAVVRRC